MKVYSVDLAQETIAALRSQVEGAVVTPQDPDYDTARSAWNLSVTQYPAVVVTAQNAEDVVAAVRFARAHGLEIAVQSTGHGVTLPADSCMLIVTSRMNGVVIDAEAQIAHVQGGAQWHHVLGPAQEAGLAPLLGSSPEVGVVGYTLGGGMGWLARKYGMATDSVVYFDVVTADGELIRASANEHSDLFWALRGGGGSFGVITSLGFRVYPETTIYGGNLFYPIEMASAVITRFREWIQSAPEALTSAVTIMNFPPLPVVPEPLRGKSAILVRGCYAGPVEEGEALIQQWIDWQAPFINTFHAMPVTEIAAISNDPRDPMPAFASGGWMTGISDETVETLLHYAVPTDHAYPLVMTEIRHAGGAIARPGADSAAFSHRDAPLVLSLVGASPTPEVKAALSAYVIEMKQALGSAMHSGVYMNFLEGHESRQRTRDAYPSETYRRLIAVKAKYDPENVFCHGFDIPASAN
jgi:FAD/FMN-containing dehydrogenase